MILIPFATKSRNSPENLSWRHCCVWSADQAGFNFCETSDIITLALSRLGSIYGQAQYIDKHGYKTYSFREQIGAGILGALIGGMFDQPTKIEFQTRYTIELANGEIVTNRLFQVDERARIGFSNIAKTPEQRWFFVGYLIDFI